VLRSEQVTPEEIRRRLQSKGLEVDELSVVQPSLEDVFLDVVERAGSAAA